jgi:phage baseplate assembly protein W
MDAYVGFSSLQYQYNKDLIMRNVDIIKQDILNNIYTRRGERVMMFNYGTSIPDLMFDPLDDTTVYIVEEDITTVFKNEPRVQLQDLRVIPLYDQNALMVFADVYYTYLNYSDQMSIQINFASSSV